MARKSRLPNTTLGLNKPKDRVRHRMILAIALSMVLHILLAIALRPKYKAVADHAVDFSVADIVPGPPKGTPKPPAPAPKEPEVSKPEPEPPKAPGVDNKKNGKDKETSSEDPADSTSPDAGLGDGGPETDGAQEALATQGTEAGTGTGICMPNLFPFARRDATWMLWVSLMSFRETALEDSVGATLERFALGNQLNQATGLDPKTDVEGVLVAAEDVFSSETFRVVVGYDSGQEELKEALTENLASETPVTWTPQPGGSTGKKGDAFFHLAGTGRVMVAGKDKSTSGKATQFDTSWPPIAECVSKRTMQPGSATPSDRQLANLAKSFISPDPTGRWPVALLTTTDPRTVGLGGGRVKGARFEHAIIRAFFSEPIRIEGEVLFRGKQEIVKTIGAEWMRVAKAASRDPFFIMAGLSKLFDGLVVATKGNKLTFSLTLTEAQARAGMLFMQLQSDALERQLKKQ